ncbi:MAG TPA: tail fiber domain-containing protein [Moheibacter sp.]|nr:tail fiber domain-containing protein [Moheibacter sp.]
MYKHATLLSALLAANLTFSQIGIGTSNPHPDALLELDATDIKGGLLLPRLALTSTTDPAPMAAHFSGMTLYNTATTTGENSVTPGYYYNNGTSWIKIKAGGDTSNVWETEGNAQTNSAINFIGTTDNNPLVFKANNKRVGYLDARTRGSLYLGLNAGSPNMNPPRTTAVGEDALSNNSTGEGNTAIGFQALQDNEWGSWNTASGSFSLYRNVSGAFNTAFGNSALFNTREIHYSTAVGSESLLNNLTGRENTAVGSRSMTMNFEGHYNTAIGFEASFSSEEGNGNTTFGTQAYLKSKKGEYNTAIGAAALLKENGGSDNTGIGSGSTIYLPNSSNATAIGAHAIVIRSNEMRIGNSSVKRIEAQVPLTLPSDARFKSNVQQNVPGLEFITQLNPVTYYFDNHKMAQQIGEKPLDQINTPTVSKKIHSGFIAQEVEQVAQALQYDFDGINAPQDDWDYYTLSYSQFVVPLVQAVKEQQEMIDSQQDAMAIQEKLMEAQNLRTETLEAEFDEQNERIQSQQALIETLQSKMSSLATQLNL